MFWIRIFGIIFMMTAAGINYFSRYFVTKFKLDMKITCDYYGELEEKEINEYKFNKAQVNLKILAMFILIPGIFMLLYSYS